MSDTATATTGDDEVAKLQDELDESEAKNQFLSSRVAVLEEDLKVAQAPFHPATIAVFGTLFGSTVTTVGYVLEHRFPWLPARYLFGIPACIIGCVFLIVAFRRCSDD